MLTRKNYYDEKRAIIKELVNQILIDLIDMKNHYIHYLENPSIENKENIMKMEHCVNKNEKKVEKTIREVISLQSLDKREIKWLFTMNRIIRELERVGDQMTNIIKVSKEADAEDLRPMIHQFFQYENKMIVWLKNGIKNDDSVTLQKVIDNDQYVNQLNKHTYKELVTLINKKKAITESKLKTVIISRFLERVGDHLVNAARIYIQVIDNNI